MREKSSLQIVPDHWPPRYNVCMEECSMISGPCACGSWHHLNEDWVKCAIGLYGISRKEENINTVENDELSVSYYDSQVARNMLYNKILKWFLDNEMFDGESIVQSDVINIDAPDFFAELANDIFKFKVNYKN